MASTQTLDALKTAITQKPPFCSGAITLSANDGYVFYRTGEDSKAEWIDLAKATGSQLESLARACLPATFGLEQRDVLDESYRKAGKMDNDRFATNFDVTKLHLVDRIHTQLLDGVNENKTIRAELYKLNVYGEGAFFKSHKDTPRSDTMFGSLVVVFPTTYEGGNLVLRQRGEEWTFDAAEITRDAEAPAIAYIALYSDVDHEVTLVKSGYRVTLTYNLYFESGKSSNIPPSVAPVDLTFNTALSNALLDPYFLPNGGLLGFGLSFMYPIAALNLKKLLNRLKGSDAVIKRVCDQLLLDASLKAIYKDYVDLGMRRIAHHIMVDEVRDMNSFEIESMTTFLRADPYGGKVIYNVGSEPPVDWNKKPVKASQTAAVLWVTPLTEYARFSLPYVAYGNEATLAHVYGNVCLVVKVGPFGQRKTKGADEDVGNSKANPDEFDNRDSDMLE